MILLKSNLDIFLTHRFQSEVERASRGARAVVKLTQEFAPVSFQFAGRY
jgi:hypothetical protein